MTLYELLGVDPGASAAEIQRAWREQVKRFHPDAHPGAPEAVREQLNRQVAEINAAYEVLRDPETRAAYDRSLEEFEADVDTASARRPPGPDNCWVCGASPAANVRFRQESGRLVSRVRRWMDGPFCRTCGTAVFRELTNRTLITGWWGVISFFVNFVTIIENFDAYRVIQRLPPPRPDPSVASLLAEPLDVGKPLVRRAGVWIAAAFFVTMAIAGSIDDKPATTEAPSITYTYRSAPRTYTYRPAPRTEVIDVGSCVDLTSRRAVRCDIPHDGYVVDVVTTRDECPSNADYSAVRSDGRVVCIVSDEGP